VNDSAPSLALQAADIGYDDGRHSAGKALVLHAPLGASRLLAAPDDRRLHVLDAFSAVLWDLQREGWSLSSLATLLAQRYGLTQQQAHEQVRARWRMWGDAGLIDERGSPAHEARWPLAQSDDPVWPPPSPRPLAPGARRVVVADRHIALRMADPLLQCLIDDALGSAHAARMQAWPLNDVHHALTLQGSVDAWRLNLGGATVRQGKSADAALVATLSTLTELGCRPAERMLVVHGAGLVDVDGRGLLLVAPGGSGKTTLAAALDTAGYSLLSDDVVPVNAAGELLGLGLPFCLKPGSWPVLASRRPGLMDRPAVQRFSQTVRFMPALQPAAGAAVPTACLLLSRYAPGEAPGHARISPEQALQGLIEAEAVLRDLTQPKIEALANWLNKVPAFSLNYPNLASGLALVQQCHACHDSRP